MSKDKIWKDIISKFFNSFTEFFLPELHQDIDFKSKITFLDKELLKISQKSGGKNRDSDKLVEVKLKDGTNRWVLIHIEVQDSRDKEFALRMYQYQYRIFDKFNKKVVALAIFTDSNKKFNPDTYNEKLYGTEILYRFNTYKVLEQSDKKELLKQRKNPFALIILASLYQIEAKKDDNRKYNFKIELVKLLLSRGYSKKDILNLFEFIDLLIRIEKPEIRNLFYSEVEEMGKTKEVELIGDYKEVFIKITTERIKAEVEKEVKAKVEKEVKAKVEKEVKAKVEKEVKAKVEKEVKAKIDESKHEEAKKIAKSLKSSGIELKIISASTGLTKKEIENL